MMKKKADRVKKIFGAIFLVSVCFLFSLSSNSRAAILTYSVQLLDNDLSSDHYQIDTKQKPGFPKPIRALFQLGKKAAKAKEINYCILNTPAEPPIIMIQELVPKTSSSRVAYWVLQYNILKNGEYFCHCCSLVEARIWNGMIVKILANSFSKEHGDQGAAYFNGSGSYDSINQDFYVSFKVSPKPPTKEASL